jgi:hypothetical protein
VEDAAPGLALLFAHVLHALENVEKYGAHPQVLALEGTSEALTVTVENDGYQPLRNGTLTVDDATVELPDIGAGNTTQVRVEGSFETGEVDTELVYQKRSKHSPMGTATSTVELAQEGDALVAELASNASAGNGTLEQASTDDEGPNGVAAPGAAAVLAGLLGALVVARPGKRA